MPIIARDDTVPSYYTHSHTGWADRHHDRQTDALTEGQVCDKGSSLARGVTAVHDLFPRLNTLDATAQLFLDKKSLYMCVRFVLASATGDDATYATSPPRRVRKFSSTVPLRPSLQASYRSSVVKFHDFCLTFQVTEWQFPWPYQHN